MKKAKPDKREDLTPSDAFVAWWTPSGTEEGTGAAVGGHPDADRIWARPEDNGRYTRRRFGLTARDAWIVQTYRDEFNAWVAAGSPERVFPYVSYALPIKEQQARWGKIADVLRGVGRPIPPDPLSEDPSPPREQPTTKPERQDDNDNTDNEPIRFA
jgi:hypothetical protein